MRYCTRAFLAIFTLITGMVNAQSCCYFTPPEGWTPAAKETLTPLVKMGFLDPQNLGFRASLNLAEEEVECNLEAYLEAVKNIHTRNHHNTWSNLGTYSTKAGPAVLTQIDTSSPWGPVRIMQLILMHNAKAYVLTAAASKKQFQNYLSIFKSSFSSLSIVDP